MERYRIFDSKTQQWIDGRTYAGDAGRKAAYRKADRMDNEYGAVRYVVMRERAQVTA